MYYICQMDKLFNFILGLFTNKERGLLSKIAYFSILLCLLLIVDNILGFSYYLDKSNKIETLYKTSSMLQDSNIDVRTRQKIKALHEEILNRENLYSLSLLFINNSFISKAKNIKAAVQSNIRSEFIFVLTSCGFFIFMAVISIILFPFHQPSGFGDSLLQKLGALIVFVVALYLISIAFYQICNQFGAAPIFGNWWFNYTLNTIFQVSIIYLVPKLNKYANPQK